MEKNVIIGRITKVGKVKDYGHSWNFGRTWQPCYKFFIEVDSNKGKVLAMVECEAKHTDWGLKIPEEADRQKPFVGDVVRFTTHRLRDTDKPEDRAKWASVTFNQSFEIIEKDEQARKERDEWIEEQKALRQTGRI